MPFRIHSAPARSILTATSGFNAEAGFTHSLTPARNCTYGCSYCYVPTMGIYGGLRPGDAARWGQETTFKSNAAELLARALRPDQVIYCSPLVDPFQPAEADVRAMPAILETVAAHPPRIFILQTRSSLIFDYVDLLRAVARRTALRVSFSITTNDDAVRKAYEPHCDPIQRRFDTVRELVAAKIDTYTALAPLLPCDPERLLDGALDASPNPIICDAMHTRAQKPRGATTRDAAMRISDHLGHAHWHDPQFQTCVLNAMRSHAQRAGRAFETGPAGFRFLAAPPS